MTPQMRRKILLSMPNVIADGYEPPRVNLQAVLQRLADNVADLQRRNA